MFARLFFIFLCHCSATFMSQPLYASSRSASPLAASPLVASSRSASPRSASPLRGDLNNDGAVTVGDLAILVAYLSGDRQQHAYVDLGLESGTLWADCNVGATHPEGYGSYFAWGETTEKTSYYWAGYFDSVNGSSTDFQRYKRGGETCCIGTDDDAATVNWGCNWQMPTLEQFQELKMQCTWYSVTQNGVSGMKVVGPNGNHIFLPKSGSMSGNTLLYQGKYFYYWTGDLYCMYDEYASNSLASYMDASFNNAFQYYGISRCNGYPIRPVVAPNAFIPDPDINADGILDLQDLSKLSYLIFDSSASNDMRGDEGFDIW